MSIATDAPNSVEPPAPAAGGPESAPSTAAPRRGLNRASLAWGVVGCLLLGASGTVRTVQDRQHRVDRAYKETCPVDLAKFPDKVGEDWKLTKAGDRKLDDLTMRITGGSDHIIRTYANDLTGVYVTILVLFGPAEPVLPHVPAICYPANGFEFGDPPMLRTIAYPAGKDNQGRPAEGKADFLLSTYSKPNGRQVLREAVYHSFRLDGLWSPFVGQGRKFPRRNPGVFKVQIHRLVAERESVGQGDPIESFLRDFVAELESEIKAGRPKAVASK